MAKTEILGIGELKQNFGKLKDGMETRIARAMVVAAGGVLKKKAKGIAQGNGSVRTGAMIKNIAIKREPQTPSGTVQYNMGVRHGRNLTRKQKSTAKLTVGASGRIVKKYADDPYYWRFVEFGHKVTPRKTGDTGVETLTYTRKGRNGEMIKYTRKRGADSLRARRAAGSGTVPAKPFLGPALEQGKTEAIEAMGKRLQKELDKAGGT